MNTISKCMTQSPSSIRSSESVVVADERMHRLGVRHLPVVSDGKIVGLVSDRDIALVHALEGADLNVMSVAAIMRSPVYTCTSGQSIGEVALEMATRKVGSCVVVDGETLVGMVTTVDLMRYLAKIEGAPAKTVASGDALSELVRLFQQESPILEAELGELERTLRGSFSESRRVDKQVRLQARDLCEHMLRYFEEEALVVGRTAARNPSPEQARLLDELHSEHREQTKQLKLALARIGAIETQELAHGLLDLIPIFRSKFRRRASALESRAVEPEHGEK